MSSVLNNLDTFGLTSQNTLTKYLVPEFVNNDSDDDEKDDIIPEQYRLAKGIPKTQVIPRQVKDCHYTYVIPEPVPSAYHVCTSSSCAEMIGLDPKELQTKSFIEAFSGNKLLPGLDKAYATVYGCHCYGSWFGQLGDGRAMGIGEVTATNKNGDKQRYELQLKGCGRSPYSRGFDGRAVLRSSVREFLVSEAMYSLNVSTTRALSVIGTGLEVRRPWYAEKSENQIKKNTRRRSPDVILFEPGAVLCRIAPSFLRFSQLELFAIRKEHKRLVELANFAIFREYPELLNIDKNQEEDDDILKEYIDEIHHPLVYVKLMRSIAKSTSKLVADWLRVGYIQGNMNSDNTLIGGRTIDYGPFGWMESYDPYYQPFTSDGDGKFAFIAQPTAMNVNNQVLGVHMCELVKYVCDELKIEAQPFIDEIKDITTKEFQKYFFDAYDDVRRRKLGFKSFTESDYTFWGELEVLLAKSKIDYTIFFRQLALAADCHDGDEALLEIQNAFYTEEEGGLKEIDVKGWTTWLNNYVKRIKKDNMNALERKVTMNQANPKYVPRNWMSMIAYESAEKGDYSKIEEIHTLLSKPYDEQSEEMTEKYYRKAPSWALDLAGSTFMS
jgi:uncharacterized protein YdiU (UPF0061 family)